MIVQPVPLRTILYSYFLRLFCLLLSLFAFQLAKAQTGTAEPRNIKILEEHKDEKGNTVRTIQYYEGKTRVVETRIIRPFARLSVKIDPDTLDMQHLMLVINKTRFVLDVYYRRVKIRSYKVVFGPKPKENKVMKGDRRTPEGWFVIKNKHNSARYNKFMQIDYPNKASVERFNTMKAEGRIPQSAEIGGDIGIHGIWKGGDEMIDMGVGWTDGCIAMKNDDIDDLYKLVKPGAKVLVRK